ncbi:ABC transporter permease [Amycolatopsis anabasis]|uniref:ABC transporter permease n=1 Tax=Amycolatopsis anabasis TaxID=1840409 RepID=UPI00131DEF29|nr:ABC transporter permease subunit [Amycolatopsis anabasis]
MITDLWHWFGDPANWTGADGVPNRLGQHLGYTALALAIALVVAVPLGLFVGHTGRGGVALVSVGNAIRALPTLGLVTFLFLIFTESVTATVIGLVVLAIPPILAGTYAGLQATDHGVVDAAEGVGMTGWQRLWQVEVPIALPLVLGGIRNAVLQLVATAAVAAYVGLGGLGRFLLDGLAILDYTEVVAGALLTALLAIVLDLVFAALQRAVVPRGVRLAAAAASGRKVSVAGGTA